MNLDQTKVISYVTEDKNNPKYRPINLKDLIGVTHLGFETYNEPSHIRRVDYYGLPDNSTQLIKLHERAIMYVDNKKTTGTVIQVESWRIQIEPLPAAKDGSDE